jgi:hypothetical protein
MLRLTPFALLAALPPFGAAAQEDAPVSPAPAEDVVPVSPAEVLELAFWNRYQLDARAELEVTVTSKTGAVYTRRAEVASKWIDGRLHSLGRFTYPEELRDLALLAIDHDDRDDDHFVWLPDFRKIRRVSSAQRADLFQGTDLAFEDLERRASGHYEAEFLPSADHEGEEVWVVSSRPTYGSGYERVEYVVAKRDGAILFARYYKRGAAEPFKTIETPRERTEEHGGHMIPMRIHAVDLETGTRTDVKIEKLAVNPALSDGLFTQRYLLRERPLPSVDWVSHPNPVRDGGPAVGAGPARERGAPAD